MLLERAVALSREWNIAYLTPIALAALGHVYAGSGRVGEGVSWLQQALAAYASAGIGYLHSMSTVQLGEAYLLAGRVEEAQACGAPCRGARPRAWGTRSRGLGPPPPRRDGVTSRLPGRGGGRSPLRHLHGLGLGARHAPARRSLPPQPRQAPRASRRSAGGHGTSRDGDEHVPRDGHAVLVSRRPRPRCRRWRSPCPPPAGIPSSRA